jgi:putative Holliday junction resolvase
MSHQTGNRFLGIDYGSRRVGIAISDPLNIIARGLTTLDNVSDLVERIAGLVHEYSIGALVVGMPLNLKGDKGTKALEVEEFIERLRLKVNVAIIPVDERFTTTMAHATVREMGVRKKKRESREHIDEMAASILLQGYLDARKKQEAR